MRAKKSQVSQGTKPAPHQQVSRQTKAKLLYIDNFRGFENTYVPIEDVSFFVGENSTGKSSILSLLKLLSSPMFWFRGSFNTDDVSLGNFSDIVSINSRDRSYFSIGFIDEITSVDKKSSSVRAFLFTFHEQGGMPQPAMHIFAHEGTELRIRYEREQVTYKERSIAHHTDIQHFVRNVFSTWVKAHRQDRTAYKAIGKKDDHLSNLPPAFIGSVVAKAQKKKMSKGSSSFFPMDLVVPAISGHELVWLAPIRTRPRRTYDEYKLEFSPEGGHTPYLIKKILEKKTDAKNFKKFLRRIGRDSGLFETVKTRDYARGATAPFELDIILNKKALSISNVGYGISQALPVIVEVFARPKASWFAIQQPEIHLHPKAQAALGDVLYELTLSEEKRFLVETHSDYMIDRYCLNYKKKSNKTKPKAQILYFERTQKGNRVFRISIGADGELPSDQPQGYREFFLQENLRLLEL